jgi:hypothetical protein
MLLYVRVALLAPGVALHEFSHHIFCLLTGVKVHRVVYFRFGSPAGFVVHEEPELYRQIFAIVAGPVFLNSAVAVVLLNLALRQATRASDAQGFALVALMVWLGVSAALQALPSRADATNLLRSSTWHILHGNPVAVVGYPAAITIYIAQLAKPLGSEWFYALLMAYVAERGFMGLA